MMSGEAERQCELTRDDIIKWLDDQGFSFAEAEEPEVIGEWNWIAARGESSQGFNTFEACVCDLLLSKNLLPTLFAAHPELAAKNQSEQHLEMVNAPAPSVPDSKTLQFLTDVLTAAGLLRHGKKDAGLATRIADESCRIRQQLFSRPPEQPADLARDAERWLSQRDLELLVTFGMQADDCDADGHTLSKEQTRRLCELGVLRNVGFGRSEMTAFGGVLFDQHWEQSRSLPLRTHAEYAALAAEKGGA